MDAVLQRQRGKLSKGKRERGGVIWAPQPGSQQAFLNCPIFECLYEGSRGPGKMLANDTLVLTPLGFRCHGDLRAGQWVITPNNERAKITHVWQHPNRECYCVKFDDGGEVIAGDEHLWKFHIVGNRRKIDEDRWHWNDTLEMQRHIKSGQSVLIPTVDPLSIQCSPRLKELPIDPYLLGLLLGDGCFTQGRVMFCTTEDTLSDYVIKAGFKESTKKASVRHFTNVSHKKAIADIGLKNTNSQSKFVPKWYKLASISIRLAVLQGLMDTDGTADKKGYVSFTSISHKLANDVLYLARSLGAKASMSSRIPKCNGVPANEAFTVYIQPAEKFAPFRLGRKIARINGYMHKELCRRVVSIEPVGKRDCTCIHIDHPEHLYVVTDSFVITHNSDSLLMDFAQFVGRGYAEAWKGILFRRQYPDLDEIMSKSKKWFHAIFPEARYNISDHRWTWPDGEVLMFRYASKTEDYWNYHGHEYPWVAFDELSAWSDDELYLMMKTICRSSDPNVPRHYRATCNPYGPGHNWVKARFIDPAPRGIVITDEDGSERVTIHGSIWENIILLKNDPGYLNMLKAQTGVRRKAWLEGDWDIVAGGMFDDVWDPSVHVVHPFDIPSTWRIDRSFDWGSAKPYSVGFWAESDGSDVVLPGNVIRPTQRGDLYRIGELYGWTGKPNEGTRELAVEVARKIRDFEKMLNRPVHPGPADSSIFAVDNGNSIAGDMEKAGVRWLPSDKKAGSRINGWEIMRERLSNAIRREGPGLFVFETCRQFIRTVPTLSRDAKNPDDVNCFVSGSKVNVGSEIIPIEKIKIGDMVNTPFGFRYVLRSGISGKSNTFVIQLSDDTKLEGTPNHKIYVQDVGLVALCDLKNGMEVIKTEWQSKHKFIAESSIESILEENILNVVLALLKDLEVLFCIDTFGEIDLERYRKDIISITKTEIRKIIESKILNVFQGKNIQSHIAKKEKKVLKHYENNGLIQTLENLYCAKMLKKCIEILPKENLRALYVESNLKLSTQLQNTVLLNAIKSMDEKVILKKYVQYAETLFPANLIPKKKTKLAVINVVGNSEEKIVYNLTTEQAHLFYVDGILVSNTDAEDHCADEVRYKILMKRHSMTVRQAS